MTLRHSVKPGLIGGVLALALGIWACGGGGGTPSGSSGNPPPASASTITIMGERGAQSFSPNPASVSQGSQMAFRNTDSVVHHIVMNDGSLDAGDIAPGAFSPTLRLTTDGGNYHCTIHPTMVGSINRATGEPPPCSGLYCEP